LLSHGFWGCGLDGLVGLRGFFVVARVLGLLELHVYITCVLRGSLHFFNKFFITFRKIIIIIPSSFLLRTDRCLP
jgi:hypothetical protein